MTIKPIKCNADYDAALTAIDSLMGSAPDTPEAFRQTSRRDHRVCAHSHLSCRGLQHHRMRSGERVYARQA